MVVASDTHQILVVDDDPNILNLIRQILEDYEDAGVHIIEARDGQSAMMGLVGYKLHACTVQPHETYY